MNIKLLTGKAIAGAVDKLVESNFKLAAFVPGGRILALDLKRAGMYPKTIFDVGANIGQSANYFIRQFPAAKVYCFEPVKATFSELKANVNNANIHTFKEGLGAIVSDLIIHKNNLNGSSSLMGDDGRFFETETVKINTGQNFCTQNQISGVDLLKIDVEGFELEVLKGFGSMLQSSVKMIYAEVGFDKHDPYKTYIGDLLELTNESGFITSGFYDSYRWGKCKLKFFSNILLTNTTLVEL